MVAKKENNNNTTENVMNAFEWWNRVDYIEEFEKNVLQAFKNQKEWIEVSQERFSQLEENSKKLTTEWKTNIQTNLEKANIELEGQTYQDWLNKLEDIGHKSQTLATLPGKTSLEIMARSNGQMEEMFMNTMDASQKVREESTKAFKGAFEQMKQMQTECFSFLNLNQVFQNRTIKSTRISNSK